jgi:LysM domain
MDRFGLVALPRGRAWRVYAGPIAFLFAATIAVALVRPHLGTHSSGPTRRPPAPHRTAPAKPKGRVFYVVRAGDTLSGISGKTGIPTSRLLKLNPKVAPTALFIGEKIRLR